jgi:hypothetical protein
MKTKKSINRLPRLKAQNEAHVYFYELGVHLKLGRFFDKGLGISYQVVDWPVLSVAQVCTSSFFRAFNATVEHLYIHDEYDSSWRDTQVGSNHWLELLHPFTSVKSLYLSHVIVRCITPTLRELVGDRVVGVLPRPIGTCQRPGSHSIVRIWTAVLRSSCGCYSLAKKVLVGLIDNHSLPIHLVRHLLTTGHSS